MKLLFVVTDAEINVRDSDTYIYNPLHTVENQQLRSGVTGIDIHEVFADVLADLEALPFFQVFCDAPATTMGNVLFLTDTDNVHISAITRMPTVPACTFLHTGLPVPCTVSDIVTADKTGILMHLRHAVRSHAMVVDHTTNFPLWYPYAAFLGRYIPIITTGPTMAIPPEAHYVGDYSARTLAGACALATRVPVPAIIDRVIQDD